MERLLEKKTKKKFIRKLRKDLQCPCYCSKNYFEADDVIHVEIEKNNPHN